MAALLLLHASLIDRWAVRPSPVVAARSLAPAQMQASDSFPSRKVVRNQLTPAQVDALLTRVVELEARIDNLEGGGLPNVGRIGRNVVSHIGTTARRLSGRAPLPGLRRAPVRTIEDAEGVVAPTSRRSLQIGGITNASAALVGDQYAKAVGAGSAIVGKAVGAAAAAQSAVGSAVGAASSTIGGITNVSVGTTLEKSVAVIDLGAEGVVQRLSKTGDLIDKEVQSLSTEVTSKAAAGAESSQSLVVACMGVGAIAGALAPLFLWRGAPAIGAAGGACVFAYACTLNNRVGKVVRLAGVLVLVLLSRISNYFREMRRQGEFVYKTGRWFEQLDREVQKQLTKMDSAVGSPVSKLSAKVASDAAATGDAVAKVSSGAVDAVAAMPGVVGSAVSKWTSDTGGWIEEQTKIQERLQGMGDQLSELQAEWFENSQPRRSEAYAAKLFEADDDGKRPPRPAAGAAAQLVKEQMTSAKAAPPEPPGAMPMAQSAMTEAEAVAGAQGLGLFVSGWDGGIPTVMPSNMMQSKRMPPP